RADFSIAQQQRQVDLSFTEPYFLGRRLNAGFDLVASNQDFTNQAGFSENTYGGTLRLGYQFNEYPYPPLNHQFFSTQLTGLSNNVSEVIREQAGTTLTSQLSQVIAYDRRDNFVDPTRGYYITLGGDLAGLGGTERYVRGTVGWGIYTQPFEGWILSN